MVEPTVQPARINLGRYQLAYRSSGSGRPTVIKVVDSIAPDTVRLVLKKRT